ncbi:hypothetical protein JOF29_001116 [Kribbella aluminosa]|uniref:Uncharacterized protein n=1 Tax=Kribbella aluminosa TaxID=416017 RepID=A0ABS4UEG5_9ACTN|nr:hypothetical protein [Kribbella aluminosa]
MALRPLSVAHGIQHRSVADQDLLQLLARVASAREAVRQGRGAPSRDDAFRRNCGQLAASLVAYATALEHYRLPVPPDIRDELRLRRRLLS